MISTRIPGFNTRFIETFKTLQRLRESHPQSRSSLKVPINQYKRRTTVYKYQDSGNHIPEAPVHERRSYSLPAGHTTVGIDYQMKLGLLRESHPQSSPTSDNLPCTIKERTLKSNSFKRMRGLIDKPLH